MTQISATFGGILKISVTIGKNWWSMLLSIEPTLIEVFWDVAAGLSYKLELARERSRQSPKIEVHLSPHQVTWHWMVSKIFVQSLYMWRPKEKKTWASTLEKQSSSIIKCASVEITSTGDLVFHLSHVYCFPWPTMSSDRFHTSYKLLLPMDHGQTRLNFHSLMK